MGRWIKGLFDIVSWIRNAEKDVGGEKEAASPGGRFAPGCVYRGGRGQCPPFTVNKEVLPTVAPIQSRPCYDINVQIDTLYQFIPVSTLTTATALSSSTQVGLVETTQTIGTSTSLTTFSRTSELAITTTSQFFESVTVTFITTIRDLTTTTTFSEVVTGSVDVGSVIVETITTVVPVLTDTSLSFETTVFVTQVTSTIVETATTAFLTNAFAAAITIGPELKDWSYYHDQCRNITYNGDGDYTGGPNLNTTSTARRPLFISSNKHYGLYPCETFEITADYFLSFTNASNITSPLGYQGDPSYGAGLFGAFDTDTGFSFYLITTETRAYAMYSRVPSWCPCVNATNVAKPCGPCRVLDMIDDMRAKPSICNPCGDEPGGSCDVCGDCNGNRYSMITALTTSSRITTTATTTSTSTTSTTTTTDTTTTTSSAPVKNYILSMPSSGPRFMAKNGFQYYAFTYLIPIGYLTPGERISGKILLNKGAPSVSWVLNGLPRLTITNIGQRIDPKFQLASYGGSADYQDFPAAVQLALGLLAVTESTDRRSPCQGGVYEECYQGGQSIQDARFTFCTYAPIQQAGTYNLTASMLIEKLGVARITKVPRPCCPVYG